MIRAGVLSDTHIADTDEGLRFLGHLAETHLAEADLFLHAGDLVNPDILMALGDRPVYAVRGNMDQSAPQLPGKRVLELGGFRIGLIHGWGSPAGLEGRVLTEFRDVALDALVYGHTHQPVCHVSNNLLFFNPGSPTDRREAPWHSVGMLEIGNELRGRIIRLEE